MIPKRVLYIHQEGSITGSAISLRNLLSGLDRERYAPRVLLGGEGPTRALFEQVNVPVDVVKIRSFWTFPGAYWYKLDFFLNFLAFLPNRALRAYLEQLRPDFVHINDKAMLSAGFETARLRLPIVWHLRSSYFPSHSRLQARLSGCCIRKLATRLIAISEDETDGFEAMPNLRIVYNSVDFSRAEAARAQRQKMRAALELSADQVAVGQVSTTIGAVRGTWDFIQAAGLAQADLPRQDLRFFIVAGIPPRLPAAQPSALGRNFRPQIHPEDEAWQRARQAGIADRLTLTGFRKDALEFMAAMDMVVVCNRHGVLGRMPFEAMAVGRAVIATAGHSGKSRVVRDGETALVVPPAAPHEIGQAIARLAADPGLRDRLAANGEQYAHQEFDPVKNARSVMKIYEEIFNA